MSIALMKQPSADSVTPAAGNSLQHLVVDDDGAAGGWMIDIGERRVPEDVARARAERDHVRVARRQKDLVLRDRDAANAAVARRLIRADARFPDEVAGLCVERLDDVARAREIHHAVMDDGRRLIRARVVHRPDPCELQLVDVVAGDLIERAVAPPVIVAAEDEPVARRRILQHLRRHGDVVLHLAPDGDAAHAQLAPPRPCPLPVPAPSAIERGPLPRLDAAAFTVIAVLIVRSCDPAPPPIPLDDVRQHIQRHLFAERSRRLRRHRFHGVPEELVDLAALPTRR